MRLLRRLRRHRKRPPRRSVVRPRKWTMSRKRSTILRLRQLSGRRFRILCGSFVVVTAVIYTLFFTPLMTIRETTVVTEYKDINTQKLQQVVNPMSVDQNTLLLNMNDLERVLHEQFPEVSAVSCYRFIFAQQVECEALGYELVSVIKHQDQRYYINENGVVIAYDGRKLGLPVFDLILNPVFADEEAPQSSPLFNDPVNQPVLPSFTTSEEALTASLLEDPEAEEVLEEEPTLQVDEPLLPFIAPDEAPPVQPVIQNQGRKVFEVAVGRQILNPDELATILLAIQQLEEVLQRKVIQAQYVQVAGELSLTSKPEVRDPAVAEQEAANAEEALPEGESIALNEDPDHEFTLLFDLRRNLDEQFDKLKKAKEVIDFSLVEAG